MKSARSAGWGCIGQSVMAGVLALLLWDVRIGLHEIILPYTSLLFACLMLYGVVCLLYGAWGLWLGYNEWAWKKHIAGDK